MDEKFAKLFNILKKEDVSIFAGDDLHMDSVPPYGISTGCAEFDLYLGRRGGLPAGKVIEYYGRPFSGKTTAALQAAAEWQKRDGLVVFVDTEQSFDPIRAKQLGCKPENMHVLASSTIEETFKLLLRYLGEIEVAGEKRETGLLENKEFGREVPVLFIVDSITGVPTAADVAGDIDGAQRVGFEAFQIKRGLKKVNQRLGMLECKPTLIFINHAISRIPKGWTPANAKQTDSGGGFGIKFFASVRVEFSQAGNIGTADNRTGQNVSVLIEKLKGSSLEVPKFKLALTNEHGFDKFNSLMEAMQASNYASKTSKSSKVLTILPDTEQQEQLNENDFRAWVEQKGGYDSVYMEWRRWCISKGYITPWGS